MRVDAKPPPIPEQYCYRTLALVDCFSAAQPERITGYTGLYPDPNSLPPGSTKTKPQAQAQPQSPAQPQP